jgi:hypothetical protein
MVDGAAPLSDVLTGFDARFDIFVGASDRFHNI